jgi:Spy/CpxP family protein refolding chaperone
MEQHTVHGFGGPNKETAMRSWRTITVVAALGAALAGGVAAAQGPGRGRGGPGFGGPGGPGFPGGPGGLPLRELNLTDSQQELIRNITQQYREQNQKLAADLRSAADAQRKAVEALPVNEGQIRTTMQALAEVQTEMALQQARMHAEIFGVLTPAQQEQARKLQAEREARFAQQRQRREQRGQQSQ